jgi:hypothetical protein
VNWLMRNEPAKRCSRARVANLQGGSPQAGEKIQQAENQLGNSLQADNQEPEGQPSGCWFLGEDRRLMSRSQAVKSNFRQAPQLTM